MHAYAERGHDRRRALIRWIDGAQTGLFPAKAGPTKSIASSQWVWLQQFPFNTPFTSGTGFSRKAFNLHLICT
jgi:hypothetical protein